MSSASSVLPSDLVSVEVAAQQVGAHPQTSLTRCTFGALSGACTGKGPQGAKAAAHVPLVPESGCPFRASWQTADNVSKSGHGSRPTSCALLQGNLRPVKGQP